jgi:plasmid stabilization system protein ParE
MARVIWTPAALRDLARLWAFLAPKNPHAAKRAVHAIRRGMKPLAAHPDIGRPVEQPRAGLREWLIQSGDAGYVVLYRHERNETIILAIRHGREAGYQFTHLLPR